MRRVYCDDTLDGYAHESSEWALSLRVTPATQGEWKRVAHGAAAAELPYAQADCDAAAVAWVLIALARKAAAWARDVDAELARRYRAAWEAREALAPAYRASLAVRTPPVDISADELTPEERSWFDADAAVRDVLDDLRRGVL